MKTCLRCGVLKPLAEYPKNKLRSDGHISHCKKCASIASMKQAKKKPEQKAASDKRHYLKHVVKKRAYAKRRRDENPARLKREKAEFYMRNKDAVRAKQLQQAYGITVEQYCDMLVTQGGVCAVCHSVPKKRRLSVDHCHSTGEVRGLLCLKCNLLLGYAGDSVDVLDRAGKYLLRANNISKGVQS